MKSYDMAPIVSVLLTSIMQGGIYKNLLKLRWLN